jgi:hypothetical protein
MIDRDRPGHAERGGLTEQELAIAGLVGRYIERRERDETPRVRDLLASPPSSATPPSTRCAPCSPAMRRCAPTARTQQISDPTPSDVDPERLLVHTPRKTCPMPEPAPERPGSLGSVSASETSPTVAEVVRFEDLPLGSRGTRRAVVRWSDGSKGAALIWFADEILVCEGDLIGKTREQLRSLQFGRDHDWLQS